MKYNLAALTLGAFGMLLAALGGWILSQEGAAYALNGGTALKTIAALSGDEPAGLGITTRSELLLNCQTTLRSKNSLELRYMSEVSFEDMVARCRHLAEEIASASPNFSLARAVAADAARHQKDWLGMNQHLVASHLSAPNEQWIGRYRVQIADEEIKWLSPESRESYNQDLRLLVMSNKGTPYMAQQYMLDLEFRDRLRAVLAEMDETDQRRFVQTLRRLLPRSQQ